MPSPSPVGTPPPPSPVLTQTFYVFDERGNAVERLDQNGVIQDTHAFRAYGSEYTSAPTNGDPWGYGAQRGYYTDRETGFIYCTFRYYDPTLGRWMNRDPSGYAGGLNLYAYCDGNPVMESDPLGLCGDEGNDEDDDSNDMCEAQLYAHAGSLFAHDPMWKAGSKQRKEFSAGLSVIPAVAVANQAVIAVSGYDVISGVRVGSLGRAFAVVGTAMVLVDASGVMEDLATGDADSGGSLKAKLQGIANEVFAVEADNKQTIAATYARGRNVIISSNGSAPLTQAQLELIAGMQDSADAQGSGINFLIGMGKNDWHAEPNGIEQALSLNLQPRAVAASRLICGHPNLDSCANYIRGLNMGIRMITRINKSNYWKFGGP